MKMTYELDSNPSPAGTFVGTCSGILKVSCNIDGTDHLLHDPFVYWFTLRVSPTGRFVLIDFHAVGKHRTLIFRTKLTYQRYA